GPSVGTISPGPGGPTAPDGGGVVRIVSWEDPVVESAGFDPRSTYVERFWLPLLGPSATWLLRRIADGLDTSPEGFALDLDETARALGLGGLGSRHSPFRRAILRSTRYGLVRHAGTGTLAVRRMVSAIPHRHVARLPVSLQEQHDRWTEPRPIMAAERRRARLLALDLAVLGEDRAAVERHLLRWGLHPALAYESAGWASSRPAFDP
ncbi:MAG TPA: hypothetical protein VHW47_06315, partial [Acidimicrobiales bacterium]|nr:hypothetical protein [Acidimicrobiales bacterium]